MRIRSDRPFFLLLVLAAFLFLTNIGDYEHFLRAESNFAIGARDMIEHREFLLPHAPHEAPLNKPPLLYWLIGLAYRALGYTHGAARVPAALSALGLVALVYLMGCRLRDRLTGLAAAAMLATSYMCWSFARLAMPDVTLTLCVAGTLACWLLVLTERTRHERTLSLLGAVSMALGFLAKGPLAVVLCGLPVVAAVVLTRDMRTVARLRPVAGAAVFLLVAAPYFLAVFLVHGPEPLANFFVNENLQRFTGASYETSQPLLFETTALLANFAPWSLLLGVGACTGPLWRTASRTRRLDLAILLGWLLAPVAVFSVSRFKLDYYFLTSVPAAALLVALTPLGSDYQRTGWRAWATRASVALLLALPIVAMVVAVPIVSANFADLPLRWTPHVVALATFAPVVAMARRGLECRAVLALAFSVWATVMAAYLVLLPAHAASLPPRVLAAQVPRGARIYTSARADVWALDVSLYLPTTDPVGVLYGDTGNRRLAEILGADATAVALVYESDRQELVEVGMSPRVLAQAEANVAPQLTGPSLRRPARQTLYLVGQ